MSQRPPTNADVFEMIRRLVAGAAFLALFLILDWGLVSLAEATVDSESRAVAVILDGIRISSAIAASLLFIVHAVRVVIEYIRWQ